MSIRSLDRFTSKEKWFKSECNKLKKKGQENSFDSCVQIHNDALDTLTKIQLEREKYKTNDGHNKSISKTWNTHFLFKDPLQLWKEREQYSLEKLKNADAQDDEYLELEEPSAQTAEQEQVQSVIPLTPPSIETSLSTIEESTFPVLADPVSPSIREEPVFQPVAEKPSTNIIIDVLSHVLSKDETRSATLIYEKFLEGATITPTKNENEFTVTFDKERTGNIVKVNETGDPATTGCDKADEAVIFSAKEFICKIDPKTRKIEFIQQGTTAPITVKSYMNIPFYGKKDISLTINGIEFEENGIKLTTSMGSATLDKGKPHERFHNTLKPLQWKAS